MKAIINHTWIPVTGRSGSWHHFVVTRMRPTRGKDIVRVAYRRCGGLTDKELDGRVADRMPFPHETPLVDAAADLTAERYLSPDAISAWRAQRAAGWDGTAESVNKPPAFRIVYVSKNWVGKPDPSGFGVNTLASDDYSWLLAQAVKLQSNGHRIRAVEKYDGATYRQI